MLLHRVRRQPGHAKTPWHNSKSKDSSPPAVAVRGGERVASLIVVCDLDTIRSGVHANTVCETEDGTPLPVQVIRGLACQAEIIPVVLNGRGEALAVGRSQRLATPAQRDALRAMHRTCIGRLHGAVRRLSDPPRDPLGTRRANGSVRIWRRSARNTITSSTKAAGD